MRSFIVLLIAIAAIQTQALNGTLVDLDDYFSGLWAYFNLTESAAQNCFTSQITANAYFTLLGETLQYFNDFAAGNQVAVLTDATAIEATLLVVNSSLNCMQETSDYENIQNAAGYNTTNMTLLNMIQGFYYQAHPYDYAQAFTPVANLIANTEYNQAGMLMGQVLQQVAWNTSVWDTFSLAMTAYDNFVFYFFNLTEPLEIPLCSNEDESQEQLALIYLWSQTVNNSTASNVVNNTQTFFEGVGGQLLGDTAPVRYCEDETSDQQNLNNAVGYDVHSQAFFEGMQNYIASNTASYMLIFNQIYSALSNQNVATAGILWGEWLNLVAGSMN